MSPSDIVEKQLAAYNAHDASAMADLFSENAVMTDFKGNILERGRAAIRARYARLFADYPHNHAEVLRRIAVNGIVMDHERVTRTPGTAPFDAIAVYTVENGQITGMALGR
jgi:uncharacterized protein (TIGR02246 family)